jgi:hypothetical protein
MQSAPNVFSHSTTAGLVASLDKREAVGHRVHASRSGPDHQRMSVSANACLGFKPASLIPDRLDAGLHDILRAPRPTPAPGGHQALPGGPCTPAIPPVPAVALRPLETFPTVRRQGSAGPRPRLNLQRSSDWPEPTRGLNRSRGSSGERPGERAMS